MTPKLAELIQCRFLPIIWYGDINWPHGIMDKNVYPINSALSNSKTKVTLEFLLDNAQQKTEFNRFAKSKYIHTYSKRRSHELENDETIEQNKKDLFFQPRKKKEIK